MEKRPIIIIASMVEETDFLKQKLEDFKEIKNGVYTFWEGKMFNYPLNNNDKVFYEDHYVLVSKNDEVITGYSDYSEKKIGVINSSVATYIAINKYNPILIINEGTAGRF